MGSEGTAQPPDRTTLFRAVRDIPYFIALNDEVQDYCCVTKPMLLDRLLGGLGLRSRHILCTFRWSDLPIPAELLELPHEDEDTHEYLEVELEPGRWVRVDPNWDRALEALALPISEWDGETDTTIAVPAIEIYSAEDSARLIDEEDELDPALRQEYLDQNSDFFQALNRWFATERLRRLAA